MQPNQNTIFSYSQQQLEEVLAGQPRYRAKQLYEWLHTRGASSYSEMTNLPKDLRAQLEAQFPISSACVSTERLSRDGSRKFVLELDDGLLVEAVGIPSPDDRLTVCFSTQVGCSMSCAFCATGREGFTRNISTQEIISQITAVQKAFSRRVSNLVAMGQGEPFLNYDNLLGALRRANTDQAFGIGARHITVSTCGIIDGINRFAEEPEQFTLAISLHSAIQNTRDLLMPKLKSQPLDLLRTAIESYLHKKNRRVTFEYMMLDGINDSEEDFVALKDFCSGLLCHVNLIPLNPIENSQFEPSSKKRINYWETELNGRGISTTIRKSKGADVSGACGQLKCFT